MSTGNPAQKIQQARDLFQKAKHVAALTGAGISTPSGIPDFRSPGSGLWERYDPMEVASLVAFRYSPDLFYAWIHPLAQKILDAVPNPAHIALAQLEEAGYLAGIVTQNIDNLHRRAGSREVLEIHGHLREAEAHCRPGVGRHYIGGSFARVDAGPKKISGQAVIPFTGLGIVSLENVHCYPPPKLIYPTKFSCAPHSHNMKHVAHNDGYFPFSEMVTVPAVPSTVMISPL